VADAAQRHTRAVGERHRLRQTVEPRCDPAAVFLGKLPGLAETAARRHGEDHFAGGGMNAQRVAPRLAMPPHPHWKCRAVEHDLKGLRFTRTAVEQGAQRHRRAIPNPGTEDSRSGKWRYAHRLSFRGGAAQMTAETVAVSRPASPPPAGAPPAAARR